MSQYPTLNVSAVLLSHSHMDHCGNIGMLREDIPIMASPESIVIMKGMQDTGISSLETDAAYFSPRQPTDDLGLYLSSIAGASYQGRDFCCTEEPSKALTAFISCKPGRESGDKNEDVNKNEAADKCFNELCLASGYKRMIYAILIVV